MPKPRLVGDARLEFEGHAPLPIVPRGQQAPVVTQRVGRMNEALRHAQHEGLAGEHDRLFNESWNALLNRCSDPIPVRIWGAGDDGAVRPAEVSRKGPSRVDKADPHALDVAPVEVLDIAPAMPAAAAYHVDL